MRVSFGQTQIQVPDQTLWLTALAVIGLGVVIGAWVMALSPLAILWACAWHHADVGCMASCALTLVSASPNRSCTLGPIVAAVAMLTMSLAVAASVGAFAISTMFLPMVIFMLMFGGFFGSFALLGVGLVFPQLVSMVSIQQHGEHLVTTATRRAMINLRWHLDFKGHVLPT